MRLTGTNLNRIVLVSANCTCGGVMAQLKQKIDNEATDKIFFYRLLFRKYFDGLFVDCQ